MFKRMLFNRFVNWVSKKRNRRHRTLAGELPFFDKENWTNYNNVPVIKNKINCNHAVDVLSQIADYFGIDYMSAINLFVGIPANEMGYKNTRDKPNIRNVLYNLRNFEKNQPLTLEEFQYIIDDFVSKGFDICRGQFHNFSKKHKAVCPYTMLLLTNRGTYGNSKIIKDIFAKSEVKNVYGIPCKYFWRNFDLGKTIYQNDNGIACKIYNYIINKYPKKCARWPK